MYVAHVLRKYDPRKWAGTETYLSTLYTPLKKEGIYSTFFCPEINQPFTDDLLRREHQVRTYRSHVPIWGIPQKQKDRLKDIGGNILSFDLLWKLWKQEPIDIIHSHALLRIGASAQKIAKMRKIPFVVTIHGGYFDLPQESADILKESRKGGWEWGKAFGALLGSRELIKKADAVITVNECEKEAILQKYPDKRVEVITSGINTEKFQEDHTHYWNHLKDKKVILTVGRIDPVKNQEWLIDQLPKITKEFPDAYLVFAGEVTHPEYAQKLVQSQEHILFAGAFPPNDPKLIGLYQIANLFVLPSIAEPFGLVMLEAWAAGKPVLSSRTSGGCQLIEEGKNGFLFDLSDPDTFLRHLFELLKNKELSQEIGSQGKQTTLALYDTKMMAKKTLKLYQDLRRV